MIIIEATDRLHPDLFFAWMERIYGVIVPPRVPCRIVALVALEMARAEPHTLPIARFSIPARAAISVTVSCREPKV